MPEFGNRDPESNHSYSRETPPVWSDYLRLAGEVTHSIIRLMLAMAAWPVAVILLVRDYQEVRTCLGRIHIGVVVLGGAACLFLAGHAAGADHWWTFGIITAVYLIVGLSLLGWIVLYQLFSEFDEPTPFP